MSFRAHNRPAPFLQRPVEEAVDTTAEAFPDPSAPNLLPPRPPLSGLLEPVELDTTRLRQKRIVSMNREHPASAVFDVLRTKLLRTARQNSWTTIGITAPTPRSGTTVVTLNLAFSLSYQMDCRTILLDLNLRNPKIAAELDIEGSGRFGEFLRGEVPLNAALVRHGGTLAIGAVNEPVPSAAEVLQAKATVARIGEIEPVLQPDIIIADAPPVLQRDDFQAALGLFDAVLLVADAQNTLISDIDRCEREISEQTNLAGVIVNRCNFAR